ncbi:MAG TPA: TOBE-like domain-containing protein [Kiritimatiellia bacterium]|nr:TOBE-like domain-containing protein [Kiritimatiellia bacterium]
MNLFHTRVRDGRVQLGDLAFEAGINTGEALIHARPHDIEISREATNGGWFKASILRIHAIGPIVRVELLREDDKTISEAELTRERYAEQRLIVGEDVFFAPKCPVSRSSTLHPKVIGNGISCE